MKTAKEFASDPEFYRDPIRTVRAIQADALEAAALVVEGLTHDSDLSAKAIRKLKETP